MSISAKSQKSRFSNDDAGDDINNIDSSSNISQNNDKNAINCVEDYIDLPESSSNQYKNVEIDGIESQVEPITVSKTGFNTDLPNTFKGQNGGTAEDAELLAEMMAISSRSKTALDITSQKENESSHVSSSDKATNDGDVPPWKKKPGKSRTSKSSADQPPWKKKVVPTSGSGSNAEIDETKIDVSSSMISEKGKQNIWMLFVSCILCTNDRSIFLYNEFIQKYVRVGHHHRIAEVDSRTAIHQPISQARMAALHKMMSYWQS